MTIVLSEGSWRGRSIKIEKGDKAIMRTFGDLIQAGEELTKVTIL